MACGSTSPPATVERANDYETPEGHRSNATKDTPLTPRPVIPPNHVDKAPTTNDDHHDDVHLTFTQAIDVIPDDVDLVVGVDVERAGSDNVQRILDRGWTRLYGAAGPAIKLTKLAVGVNVVSQRAVIVQTGLRRSTFEAHLQSTYGTTPRIEGNLVAYQVASTTTWVHWLAANAAVIQVGQRDLVTAAANRSSSITTHPNIAPLLADVDRERHLWLVAATDRLPLATLKSTIGTPRGIFGSAVFNQGVDVRLSLRYADPIEAHNRATQLQNLSVGGIMGSDPPLVTTSGNDTVIEITIPEGMFKQLSQMIP